MTLHPQWHVLDAERGIVRTFRAPDRAAALAFAAPLPADHTVASAASHAIGYVRPLASDRCASCGIRQRKDGRTDCERCADAARLARQRLAHGGRELAVRGKRRKGERGPDRMPRRVPPRSSAHREAIGRATAARHAARREASA